jgi:hypothetical protein
VSVETSPDLLAPRRAARPQRSAATALLDRPAPRRRPQSSRVDIALGRLLHSPSLWVLPVMLVQVLAIWRYASVPTPSTTAAVASGHLILAHLLHGSPSPDLGRSAAGAPSVYAVPAALLADLGGTVLVHLGNACLGLAATWFTYRGTRALVGQGAALIASAVLALNVDMLVDARVGGGTALAASLLAIGLWLAASAAGRTGRVVALGPVLALAVAACYTAAPLALALLLVLAVCSADAPGPRPRLQATGVAALSAALSAALVVSLASSDDWGGLRAAGARKVLTATASATMAHQLRVDVVPLLLVAAVGVGISVTRRRATALMLLFGGSVVAVVAQAYLGAPSAPQSGLALVTVLAAPPVARPAGPTGGSRHDPDDRTRYGRIESSAAPANRCGRVSRRSLGALIRTNELCRWTYVVNITIWSAQKTIGTRQLAPRRNHTVDHDRPPRLG